VCLKTSSTTQLTSGKWLRACVKAKERHFAHLLHLEIAWLLSCVYSYSSIKLPIRMHYKPVDELAHVLPSFKRPLISFISRLDGWHLWQHQTIMMSITLLISRRRCGLAYFTLHATKQGWQLLTSWSAEFLSECGRAKCFFSHSSNPDELNGLR